MKRFFISILLFCALQLGCFAQTGITFIYINGSNNNDLKMKNWYEKGVKKLHPCIKTQFENNELAREYFLKNGDYYINSEPSIFFWGDRSHNDLSFVEKNLAISKGFSPWLAYQIRSALTHYLHDAIWVQKYHNMNLILNDLQKTVLSESEKGNQVVLYGYSAGSFVTYQYLLTHLPYIIPYDFFSNLNISDDEKKFVKNNPMNNTCMSAITDSKLAVLSAAGHITPNINPDLFKQNYLKLNDSTKKMCTPIKSLKGIVNFATPIVLFYSDLSDPKFELTYYNRLLFEYIIENDMFWLTVNYREDPLGFPGGRNLSIEEIENIANLDIDPHAGFMYDHSDTKGRRPFFVAHTSYWATRNNFSKAIVKAYVKGYTHQLDDEYKTKKNKIKAIKKIK